ncbi:hypothetical protein HYV49_02280 [Candidatus Pacearchaeota archaeon]|nr:hypothetical protein [Candidatus Pacearchaeota archaeon]
MTRIKEEHVKRSLFAFIIFIIAIFIILNAVLFSFRLSGDNIKPNKEISFSSERYEPLFFNDFNGTTVEMLLPAVDSNKKGVATILRVQATKGDDKTLVEIGNLLFWADTQSSIRTARDVAENITGISLDDVDLIYSVDANASVIGGPSAGAAITIATIAAIQGKRPRADVMISGAINHDGTIGPVSEILEKANVAKANGAVLFLVPLLHSGEIVYETREYCRDFGSAEFCTQETYPRKIDVGKESGIEVREVQDIKEAMKYFFD